MAIIVSIQGYNGKFSSTYQGISDEFYDDLHKLCLKMVRESLKKSAKENITNVPEETFS